MNAIEIVLQTELDPQKGIDFELIRTVKRAAVSAGLIDPYAGFNRVRFSLLFPAEWNQYVDQRDIEAGLSRFPTEVTEDNRGIRLLVWKIDCPTCGRNIET